MIVNAALEIAQSCCKQNADMSAVYISAAHLISKALSCSTAAGIRVCDNSEQMSYYVKEKSELSLRTTLKHRGSGGVSPLILNPCTRWR